MAYQDHQEAVPFPSEGQPTAESGKSRKWFAIKGGIEKPPQTVDLVHRPRRRGSPPARQISSIEREKLILEQIAFDLRRLAMQANAIEQSLLADMIDAACLEVRNALASGAEPTTTHNS